MTDDYHLNDRATAAAEARRAAVRARMVLMQRRNSRHLNDRAKAAAEARAAAVRARQILLEKQYWRAYGQTLNQRATDAANMVGLRYEQPVSGMGRLPAAAQVPGVTATPASTAQWGPGERTAVFGEYADLLTKYGFNRADVYKFLRGLDYRTLQNPSLVTQAFRETGMWQERFGGVTKAREKNGMSYLNEGQIIQLEDTYRQIFTAAGIPKQYWQREDLWDLIAKDVSPQEVADRVKLAEDAVNNTDPQYVKSFREFYGIKKKDLVGYMLNRKRGVQVLQEQVAAAEIGAEARQIGMDSVGKKYAEELVDKDISRQEARQAFANVADTDQDWQKLAKMGGESLSERGLINDELGLDKEGKVGQKKRRLASQERARFGGSNAGTAGLGASTSGAY